MGLGLNPWTKPASQFCPSSRQSLSRNTCEEIFSESASRQSMRVCALQSDVRCELRICSRGARCWRQRGEYGMRTLASSGRNGTGRFALFGQTPQPCCGICSSLESLDMDRIFAATRWASRLPAGPAKEIRACGLRGVRRAAGAGSQETSVQQSSRSLQRSGAASRPYLRWRRGS